MDRRGYMKSVVLLSSAGASVGCVESGSGTSQPRASKSETEADHSRTTTDTQRTESYTLQLHRLESESQSIATTDEGSGPLPQVEFRLQVVNGTSSEISVTAELPEEDYNKNTDDTARSRTAYSTKEFEIETGGNLDLNPYRGNKPARLVLETDRAELFDQRVETYEGYEITVLSQSDVDVEWIVA